MLDFECLKRRPVWLLRASSSRVVSTWVAERIMYSSLEASVYLTLRITQLLHITDT